MIGNHLLDEGGLLVIGREVSQIERTSRTSAENAISKVLGSFPDRMLRTSIEELGYFFIVLPNGEDIEDIIQECNF